MQAMSIRLDLVELCCSPAQVMKRSFRWDYQICERFFKDLTLLSSPGGPQGSLQHFEATLVRERVLSLVKLFDKIFQPPVGPKNNFE